MVTFIPGMNVKDIYDRGNPIIIFNFSSFIEGYSNLNNLNPLNYYSFDRVDVDSADFDVWYYKFIFKNQPSYIEFLSVMYYVYMGYDVFILIDFNNIYSNMIIESLIRIIKTRYGLACNITENLADDYDSLIDKNQVFIEGIRQLDSDIENYTRNYLYLEVDRENRKYD